MEDLIFFHYASIWNAKAKMPRTRVFSDPEFKVRYREIPAASDVIPNLPRSEQKSSTEREEVILHAFAILILWVATCQTKSLMAHLYAKIYYLMDCFNQLSVRAQNTI